MRPRAAGRRGLAAWCLVVVLPAPVLAQAVDPKATPHQLLADLQSLLRLGVPVGVQLAAADSLHETTLGPAEAGGEAPAREEAIARFSATWGHRFRIRSTEDHGLVVESMRSVRCAQALGRRLEGEVLRGTPVEVLFGIAASVDPSLRALPPPGIVSGGGDGGGATAMEALTQPVEVSTRGTTLQDALDGLARSGRGIGWMAQDQRDEATGQWACRLGLLTTTAVADAGYDGAAGLGAEKAGPRP